MLFRAFMIEKKRFYKTGWTPILYQLHQLESSLNIRTHIPELEGVFRNLYCMYLHDINMSCLESS